MSKIALLFPGQGSQYIGMAKSLCESFVEARETFEEANSELGFDLKKLCFYGSLEELTKTENTQPAILTASVAAYRVFKKETGCEAAFMAGHSLGEFSALCCAGGIKFSDAVKIVRRRGQFMQEAVAAGVGGMAAVSGVSKNAIEEICHNASINGRIVVVSNYNSQDQIVISGHLDVLNEACEKLKEIGARVIPLRVSAPFHSPLMQPAADMLKEELEGYTYSTLDIPVISNVTAGPYIDSSSIIENLTKQIVQPVRWQDSMEYIQGKGVNLAVELGPQAVLKNLMRKNAPGVKTYTYENDSDFESVKRIIISDREDKKLDVGIIIKCIAAAVSTKNGNWNEQEYESGVVEPYRRIVSIREEILRDGRQPSFDEVGEILKTLKKILITKKTPQDQQKLIFNEILKGTEGIFEEVIA